MVVWIVRSFDLHADMGLAFHWNTKQLFVYVVASYASTANPRKNQIVLWDTILEATNPNKVLRHDNVFLKYALVDQGEELRANDIQLQLRWDHMPITGLLYTGEQPHDNTTTFTLPSEYDDLPKQQPPPPKTTKTTTTQEATQE
eukprot:CAMPEP_0116577888 /NCGR_PEP_ID=MMETSP0397-20121206/21392_1 /TAXON_ID=216820 /ORGANISM="Cyclophora tenuis, Strain ECT3854" /LENGTH=143 /DNA_ID=CAMNT_0004107199 /DNA_START=195 /DNA_END=623 /DNA_ORIENTATION=-